MLEVEETKRDKIKRKIQRLRGRNAEASLTETNTKKSNCETEKDKVLSLNSQ